MAGANSNVPAPAVGESKVGGGGNGRLGSRAVWFSPDPSPEVVADLSRSFPTVVTFPEEEFGAEVSSWAAAGVVAKCFGRRVQPEALVREFRWRHGFKGEIKAYGLDRGYYIAKFALPEEREKVLGVPWVVNGQLVAVERWRPAFVPEERAIHQALVWVRLPQLPVEYWGEAAIRRLVSVAGDFVGLDASTAARSRMGFARAIVRIDLGQPLRPGTLMLAGGKQIWQRFVYENLDDLCLNCGIWHPVGALCPATAGRDGASSGPEETGVTTTGPRLGPWALAIRRRPPAGGGGKGSTGLQGAPAMDRGSYPGGGWSRPSRVARRPPPATPTTVPPNGERRTERGKKVDGGEGNPFAVLAHDEGDGGRDGGSPRPPFNSKRARPNDFKGGQPVVQHASTNKTNSTSSRGQARSRKFVPNLAKGKGTALGQEQVIPEAGRCGDDSAVFMFTASDSGGSGALEDCTKPNPEVGQSSVEQPVDPMLVSDQAFPRSEERDGVQRGDQSVDVGANYVPPESHVLDHDVAVSRLRQAIQGEKEGSPVERVAVDDGDDEDFMLGEEDVAQIPHSVSS